MSKNKQKQLRKMQRELRKRAVRNAKRSMGRRLTGEETNQLIDTMKRIEARQFQ